MQVWVVMGNDYPDAVFDNEQAAVNYCATKKALNEDHQRRYGGGWIHWRANEFTLRSEP